MKEHLLDLFRFNEQTNLGLLGKIEKLPRIDDRDECLRFFSHLILSQRKWMARIQHDPNAWNLDWWLPVYPFERLAAEWKESVQAWCDFIGEKSPAELATEQTFIGRDGGTWVATPQDIVLQLNFHSIHHRAQIQYILRRANIDPDFVDYIGTKYRKLG